MTALDECIPDERAPLTEQRSLSMELQAEVTICSTSQPKQTAQEIGSVMHYKDRNELLLVQQSSGYEDIKIH